MLSSYFDKITEPFLVQSYLILCLMSFVLSLVIIFFARYFFNERFEQDAKAIQSAHKGFVPRIGGFAIYLSVLGFSLSLNIDGIQFSFLPNLYTGNMYILILSAMPIFLIGLAEDLGFYMRPNIRLLGAIISSSIFIYMFEMWITSVGIPGLDKVLSIAPLGIAFTLFATTGVVNAFNIVDGLNGLAGYLTLSSVIALSILAFLNNNPEILRFLFLIAASVVGFLVLNFPFGKIFLGDAGAYTLGYLLVGSSIVLVNFYAEISPFAVLLIFFWPVADTLLSIWRRLKLNKRADHPDRLHFHQLVMRVLEIRYFGRDKRHIVNPVSTLVLIPLISTPQVLGVMFWDDLALTVWCSVGMSILFFITYLFMVKMAKRSRRSDSQKYFYTGK